MPQQQNPEAAFHPARRFTTGEVAAALGTNNRRLGNWLRDGVLLPEAAQADGSRALSLGDALAIAAFFALLRAGVGTFPAAIAVRAVRCRGDFTAIVQSMEQVLALGHAPGKWLEKVNLLLVARVRHAERGAEQEASSDLSEVVRADELPARLGALASSSPIFVVPLLPLLQQLYSALPHARPSGAVL